MVMAIAGTAVAADLDTSAQRPIKDTVTYPYNPPQVPLQGGDTIFDATIIGGLPYSITGTTMGYIDDYDEACPYGDSTSPDVVYSFMPDADVNVNVDLCGSSYDTKVYVYDETLALIDCNDDFYFDDVCGTYVSALWDVPLMGGTTYFIIIDGYGGAAGEYNLLVEGFEPPEPCFVICDPDAVAEGEPSLVFDYQDAWNGGCNSPDFGNPFQDLRWANTLDGELWMCGVSGWYETGAGASRDTDWFTATFGPTGVIDIILESEYDCYLFELGPQDCSTTGVLQDVVAGCEAPAAMQVTGDPGTLTWLWVGPTEFTGPVNEFPYTLVLNGHEWDPPVPTEELSWGGVKALYR